MLQQSSLAAYDVRDLPEPPRSLWRIVGPGVVAAGVGVSSGEFILWPYIASQVGLVFHAGAGGGQNLCQSNWIRDKGFGMGAYVPRLVSPVTGGEEADPHAASAFVFEPTAGNMTRWQRWWRFVHVEQLFTFVLVISACSAGLIMFVYSFLLILLNRRMLPPPIRIRSHRLAAMIWSIVLYGALAGLTIVQQARLLTR